MDEVTRRFLAASGLITREDFARWWGIPSPAKGRRLLERLGDEVAPVEVEGAAAYALTADLPGLARAGKGRSKGGGAHPVRLLPAFDQYVITATRQAEKLMPGPFKARVYRPQGWLSPVLLVGGRMEGRLAPGGQGQAPGGHRRAVRRAAPRPGPARRRGRSRAPGRLVGEPARGCAGRANRPRGWPWSCPWAWP